MKHKFLLLYVWLIRTILYFLPDVPFFMRFRGFLYGLGMKDCGKDFQVTHNALIKDLPNISVGNNIFIGNFSVIMGSGEITIQDEVLVGPNVVIISGNHTKIGNSYRYGAANPGPITIGKGSWITANCTLAMDSSLPNGSVLGANSFLNKHFKKENSIYGGIPADLIK